MRIDELETIFHDTYEAHWSRVESGPTFLADFLLTGTGDDARISGIEWHQSVAVLRADVDVRIAWGYDPDFGDDRRSFAFTERFPDSSCSVCLGDVFYRGALVMRYWLLHVDGGRCILPVPSVRKRAGASDADDSSAEKYEDFVTPQAVDFARLVDGLGGGHEFDDYLTRSGLAVAAR